MTNELSDHDRAMLEFERLEWKYSGTKASAIYDEFGVTATRYYQQLNKLIDRPEALAYDPMVVKRLQRLRDARRRARSAS